MENSRESNNVIEIQSRREANRNELFSLVAELQAWEFQPRAIAKKLRLSDEQIAPHPNVSMKAKMRKAMGA